jgi:hypothetical protein
MLSVKSITGLLKGNNSALREDCLIVLAPCFVHAGI